MGKWTNWIDSIEKKEYYENTKKKDVNMIDFYTNNILVNKTSKSLRKFIEYLDATIKTWENNVKKIKRKNNIYRNNNYYD